MRVSGFSLNAVFAAKIPQTVDNTKEVQVAIFWRPLKLFFAKKAKKPGIRTKG
jgi:hypothetical protein